ncbi:telomere stability and silencing-domain-containing protein [Chlamydoabsidia padenii]|nr:telomere stability and silencing-domain-containing protein [Chlamydoabsidia padenii]
MTTQQVILNASSETICIPFDAAQQTTIGDMKQRLCADYTDGLGAVIISSLGGKILSDDHILFHSTNTEQLNLNIRLCGGKGGFGSMLRAQGGRMNAQKTTNFEACRDLQGRRIKSVNEAKKLEEELAALPQREQEKRERLEKKIEKALKEREPRKYLFDDNEFLDNREQMVESVKNAVSDVLKRSHSSTTTTVESSVNKRQKVQSTSTKKVAVSVFDDEDSDEDDDDEEEEEAPLPINSKGKGKASTIKPATTIKA